jgi:hypothetical protein
MDTSYAPAFSSSPEVTAPTPEEKRRLLIEELRRVNDELCRTKKAFSAACSGGQRGRYLPPEQFFNLKLRLDSLRRKSQGIQAEFAAAKAALNVKAKFPPPTPKIKQPDTSFELARARLLELRARNGNGKP